MDVLNNLLNLLLSPRFKAFYWQTGLLILVGFLGLISGSLDQLGLPEFAVVVIGGILSQIAKALNNKKEGKEMGFSNK